MWLAAAPPAPRQALQPAGRTALTLTLSQRRGDQSTRHHVSKRAGTFDAPSCRLEERFFTDAADGRLDEFSPLGAALVASGVEDVDSLHRYQQKAAAPVDELRRSGKLADQPRERAEALPVHARTDPAAGTIWRIPTFAACWTTAGSTASAHGAVQLLAGELGLDVTGWRCPATP